MRTQQQAEREEQQRIKNLVLNYDLGDDIDPNDGEADNSPPQVLLHSTNIYTKGHKGNEKRTPSRPEKTSANRSFRARKLQLSDVDW